MQKALRSTLAVVSILALAVALGVAADGRSTQAPPRTVTFAKDVAPILYARCVECHRPGQIAPMSLLTYDDARPWAKSIRERVFDREMPPWFADPAHGTFENNPRLTQQEIDTIVRWVNTGSAKGADSDLPPAPRFAEGWTIGEPDLVLSMQEEHAVPAEGVVEYLYFTVPTNFTEDKWVQALEIRPGNRAVVHHVIAYVQEPVSEATASASPRGLRGRIHLAGFTPNRAGLVLPPGYARRIKAGSNIVFQMHYTPNGEAAKDRTSMAVIFAKGPVKRSVVTGNALNAQFVIPAGDPGYEVKSSTTFTEDVHILGFSPHMHFRGKDFTYTAVYPDGRKEILLQVPKYDFNWQLNYKLKEPMAMPKGTRLDCVAHFDNSSGNRFNPDPTQDVRWGDQTWEEMMIGWYTFYRDADQIAVTTPAGGERN
jgi:hypothetical protein